jgi:hypothetical protein
MHVKKLESDLRNVLKRIQNNEVYSLEVRSRACKSVSEYFFTDGKIWFVLPCIRTAKNP